MFKKSIFILIQIAFLVSLYQNFAIAQDDNSDAYVPDRIIMWEKVGQRETLKKCEEHLILYVGKVEPETTYMRYIQSRNDREYILELSSFSTQAKPKPIDVTQSIRIPLDGSSPIALKNQSNSAVRQIIFSKIGQKEKILNGETINIIYDGVNTSKTYIAYQSFEGGYWIELSSLLEQKVIIFSKRCQSYIVASPATTTIRFDDVVRYEQIVWTPRVDNSWEVRIGTTQQGCKSAALDAIRKLRTKEYETNVPIEGKNKRR